MIEKYISFNRSHLPLSPIGVVLHETATPGATAEDEYRYFNSANRDASAHAFVDWTGCIKTVPFSEQAWHAGPTANSRFIGIEMCHATSGEQFEKVWNNTVELVAGVCKAYGISEKNILSHAEVSLKWGETNHTDPISYLSSYGKSMDDFRMSVKNKMNGDELSLTQYNELNNKINKLTPNVYNYLDDNFPAYAKETVQKLVDRGVLKGTDDGLNLTEPMIRLLVILDRACVFK